MTSQSKLLSLPLLVFTALAFLLTIARPAAAAMDAPWTGAGPGITHAGVDTATTAQLDYAAHMQGAWDFSAVAGSTRSLAVNYDYSGSHAWYQVRVSLERYVKRGGVEVLRESLADAGPVNCCAAPSGSFSYRGITRFALQEGDVYGFRLAGSNADSDTNLRGSLVLQEIAAPTITPVIQGKQGPNGSYTSDVVVNFLVDSDDDWESTTLGGCEESVVTTDTHGRTFRCVATNRGGTTTKSVTIKRDATAPQITVATPGSATAGRLTRTAAIRYTTTATDAMDPAPHVNCTPASGTQLGIGNWRVGCTATDAAGNRAIKTFNFTVYPPSL